MFIYAALDKGPSPPTAREKGSRPSNGVGPTGGHGHWPTKRRYVYYYILCGLTLLYYCYTTTSPSSHALAHPVEGLSCDGWEYFTVRALLALAAVRVPEVEDDARLGADASLDVGLGVEGDADGAALAAVLHARRVSQRGEGDDLAGAAVLPRSGHLQPHAASWFPQRNMNVKPLSFSGCQCLSEVDSLLP